ncbi:hypothetical protein [Streptomyces sp. NPDC019890]|uniref:hypothetical protein n=1 Tax=Streptomyces sp. NPDC019890 TaxID=3365064 RepID=UPI00384B9FA2
MRTTARLLTGTALALATIGIGAHGVYAADIDSLEIFPATATPGTVIIVNINITICGTGGHGVGDARALGVDEFQLSPGSHKEALGGQFRVPDHAQAGTYAIGVKCSNGRHATGDLVVRHHSQQPSGHVNTGVGGSVGPDTTKIAAGVAVLATAAVGGTLLLRRRASGAQDS